MTRRKRLLLAALLLTSSVAAIAVYLLVRSEIPDAQYVFRTCFHVEKPAGVTDLQCYADYHSIDPFYFLSFRITDDATLQAVLSAAGATQVAGGPRQGAAPGRAGAPEWWNPGALLHSSYWTADDGEVLLRMYVEDETGRVLCRCDHY